MSDYKDRVRESGNGKRVRDDADFVVIGTGPSGAAAAHVLAEAGHDVVMIEEGRWVKSREFDGTAFNIQKHCYRDMGTVAAMGKSMIPIIQGMCVGGGSVINAAIIWKLPRDVYDRWVEDYGIGDSITWPELEDAFEKLEKDMNVKPVSPGALGRNNALLKEGADKMGISSRIIPRNEKGCKGLAQCLTGCPIRAKQSTDLNYIPWTLQKGARLYAACKAHHIDVTNGRAKAVHADFRDPLTREKRGSLYVRAEKGVVVCASPVQTPLLLWRSGIGLTGGHLGRHFAGHPGAGVMGLFPDEVRVWEGATQGWDSEHYRQTHKVKFEALSIPPDLMASRVPGVGLEFKKALESYDRLANVGCALIPEAEGTVRPFGNGAMVSYSLTGKDVERLRQGIRIAAEIMVAAGAQSVMPGIYGVPPVLSKDEINKIDEASTDPRCYTMVMTHLFGTCRMGPDRKKSVIGPDFQVHDTPGVYVLDSSIFPTHLGVNPQHTIMAVAMAGAGRIAAS